MSGPPREEPVDSPAVNPVQSLVLQHLDRLEDPSTPRRARDLTFREIRDSLWLASRLRPALPAGKPPDGQAAPRSADAPPEEQGERPDEAAAEQHPEPAEPPPGPVVKRKASPPEEWAPGPVRTAQGAPVDTVGGGTHRQAWPTAPTLSDVRRIARALRPLSRRQSSPWRQELDEEATAERAAQDDGMWLPQWRGAPWRRYEMVLVIDSAPSMEIWQQTIQEFRSLLAHQGAFRDIRTYLIDTTSPELAERPLRAEGASGRKAHWNQLVDPTGRRIVLVLTDAIGKAWHSGALGKVLYRWGKSMPVALVQTMDQRLWSWSGLHTRRTALSAPFPGATNHQLRSMPMGRGIDLDRDGAERAVPVPVLGLTSEWISGWVRLLTAPGSEWVETTATFVHKQETIPLPAEPVESLTAEKRVLRFRTLASVQAFRLAALLAAAPLSLPLIRIVQRVLLPNSGNSELAEVMLGGLLKKLPDNETRPGRTTVSYDFIDGVREELLACGQRSETAQVARVLSAFAGHENSALRNFADALEEPDEAEEPEPTAEAIPHLRVQAAVLRALSGPYHRRAGKLRRTLGLEQKMDMSKMSPFSDRDPAEEEKVRRTMVSTKSQSPTETPQHESGPHLEAEGDDVVAAPGSTLASDYRTDDTASAPQIWGEVPLRNPDFVGREELLEQLKERLLAPGAKAAVLPEALHGMGGVGKSQTVVEYIYRHAAEYDFVWWISAEHQSQINRSFVEMAQRLGIPAAGSAETAVPAVLEALRRGHPHARWILVFDNADRPDDVRKFFPVGSGHVVVTSRNSDWGGFARPVEVDLFTRAESIELLHLRGGDLDESDADRLAAALGDLPLAIEQAAAWRSQTGMQVTEYLELLEQNRSELLSAGSTSDYQLPVAAAWNVPLNKLDAEHKASLQLLQVCAFFGPEPISRKLFIGIRDAPVPKVLGEALRDPIKLNRAIREISRYSLAKIDHRSNSLQLHRLVQTVLKNRLQPQEQDDMRHAVHFLLVSGDPGDPDTAENWRRYAELLPHATISRAVECNDRWVRALIHNLVRYLINSGDFEGARDLAQQAMNSWQRTIGAQEIDTLEITRRCGIALRRLGRIEEALELNRQTLESMRASFGDDHEILLGMLDTVAADRRSQGEFAEELAMQQQVYDRARELLGPDDPTTLVYAFNLGGCLRLMGDFKGALALDEDTLRRRMAVLGPDHSQTFGSRNALAMDQREVGKYLEAARIQEKTLVRQREIFGNDHPRTLGAIRNLAISLRKGGRHQDARRHADECLVQYRSRYGDENVDTATAMMTLSADLRVLGELDSSLELATTAYRVLVKIRKDMHPYALIAATNLAVTCRLRGDLERAKELDELAFKRLREIFDRDHPFTLVAATNLASDLAAMGDFSAAKELDEDTIERSARVLGEDHPSTLAAMLNLALDLAGLGAESESQLLHSKTVASFRRTLGPDHPATVAATKLARANCDTDTMQL
ncbi:FxSxx-COOH system tetratricopeptide repeat protein [Amycolatopsis japonica]|uniref:FxSxx-COOH system tetratricopeptide repeat protein n=1 Tax=Amycolatopsis japonica TaxID=208439 RepID=UPI003407AC76